MLAWEVKPPIITLHTVALPNPDSLQEVTRLWFSRRVSWAALTISLFISQDRMVSEEEKNALEARLKHIDKELFSQHLSIYLIHKAPLLSTVDLDEIEQLAGQKLNKGSAIYS